MAKSTRQYVFEGMELLPEALIPFVEKRLESSLKGHWQLEVVDRVNGLKPNSKGEVAWDQASLLKTMMFMWKEAFATVLGHPERSYVSELLDVRNKLSHNETFTYDDAERARHNAASHGSHQRRRDRGRNLKDARDYPAHQVCRAATQ